MGATLCQNQKKGGVSRATCPRKNWGKWGEMGENGDEDKRNVSQCLPLHLLPASFYLCALWPTKCTSLRGCAMSIKAIKDSDRKWLSAG